MSKSKKWLVFAAVSIAAIGIVVVLMVGMEPASAPSKSNLTTTSLKNSEKFQAKVSQPWVSASEDGAQYIGLEGNILILTSYGDAYAGKSADTEKGLIIGSYTKGTKVEVYAHKIKDNEYSLYGSNQYYIKSME